MTDTFESNDISMDVDGNDDDCVEVDVEVTDDVQSAQRASKQRKKKLTSKVWNFFDLSSVKVNGVQKATCRYCKEVKNYVGSQGTGNLTRHIKTCGRRDTRDVGQMLISSEGGVRSAKCNLEKFRETLITAMIMHNLELSFVEYEGMLAAYKCLHEGAATCSRNTARSDIIKLYKREKARLKNMLKETPSRICLTTDLWTSANTDGYLCLTAHFIDKKWVLQKRILNFTIMPPPHTGVALSEKIYSLISEWEIEKKLFCVTVDNASANDSFVGMLKLQLNVRKALLMDGKFFHLRCCAHILNLIVQDGLKDINDGVKKLRECAKYVKGSQGRKLKFLECVNMVSLNPNRGLRQDVPTRWNSTYTMLKSSLYFQSAFSHLEISDSNFRTNPSSLEWEKIEKISDFLGMFNDISGVFSGTKYPTANLYFPSVFMARLTLEEHRTGDDEYLRKMAGLMYSKFEKYWSEFSLILCIAVVFDPRYKLQLVSWAYKKLYGEDSNEYAKVKDNLFSLYDEYLKATSGQSSSQSATSSSSSSAGASKSQQNDDGSFGNMASYLRAKNVLKEFDIYDTERGSSVQKSQLEQYLEEPRIDRNQELDILEFWHLREARYPELANMARDILCIPVSTVASESAFSVGGKVLDPYRSSLKPDIVEALICCKDWLFGEVAKENVKEIDDGLTDLKISMEEEPISAQVSAASAN